MVERPQIPSNFFSVLDARSIFHIMLCCLGLIFSALATYYTNSTFVYVICFFLVSIFAESLFILQHEAMHRVLLSNKNRNDIVGVFLSAMLGTRLFDSRKIHMRHHAKIGTSEDPNLYWYDEKKITPDYRAVLFMFQQLFGAKLHAFLIRFFFVLSQALSKKKLNNKRKANAISHSSSNKKAKIDIVALLIMQLFLLYLFSRLSSPWTYVLFYFLPIITLTGLIESIRTFSEHVNYPMGVNDQMVHLIPRLYFVKCSLIEQAIFAPYGFHYHHLHHMYPTVPVFKLKKLHAWMSLNDINFQDKYKTRHGYLLTFFKYALLSR